MIQRRVKQFHTGGGDILEVGAYWWWGHTGGRGYLRQANEVSYRDMVNISHMSSAEARLG